MSLIFLIGMPGAGKTFWGEKIAAAYQLDFFDTDEMMERQEGITVSEIFRQYGEDWFRNKEIEILNGLIHAGNINAVISCGGGTPAWNNNFSLMKTAGCIVYLRAEIETLYSNLAKEKDTRPLLSSGGELKTRLRHLLEERKKVYERADYILQAENISVATFAQIISSCTNRH